MQRDSGNAEPHAGHSDWLIAGSAILAALLAGAIYVIAFYGYPIGGPQAWAEFGDYLGGVVNPIVGLATVILVVITLRVTRKEARDTRSEMEAQRCAMNSQLTLLMTEAELKDLHRRIEGVYDEWMSVVRATEFSGDLAPSRVNNGEFGDHRLFDVFSHPRWLRAAAEWNHSGIDGEDHSELWSFFRTPVSLLVELALYCADYDIRASNKYLTDFYRRRVQGALNLLQTLQLLPDGVFSMLSAAPIDLAKRAAQEQSQQIAAALAMQCGAE